MKALQLTREFIDGDVVLHVSGHVDMPEGRLLEEELNALLQEGHNRIILNLTSMAYAGHSWLGCVVKAWKAASAQGGHLRIANPPPEARDWLRLCHLDELIGVYNSVAEAVKGS